MIEGVKMLDTVENPKRLRHGATRGDGWRFVDYHKGKERWMSPYAYERWRVGHAVAKARRRAEKKGREFSLTVDYMMTIYPPSGLCWMTHEPMVWGLEGGYGSSPSIDRLDHNKGYTPDNVSWVSLRGNRLKSEIEKPYKAKEKPKKKTKGKKIAEGVIAKGPQAKKKTKGVSTKKKTKAWKPRANKGRKLWK